MGAGRRLTARRPKTDFVGSDVRLWVTVWGESVGGRGTVQGEIEARGAPAAAHVHLDPWVYRDCQRRRMCTLIHGCIVTVSGGT
jgi:hypothetical protein